MEIIDEGKANRHVAVTSKWVICTKDVKITINHFLGGDMEGEGKSVVELVIVKM